MAVAIPPQCAGIASEIASLEQERKELQQELAEAPPSLKPFLLRELRRVNREIALREQDLHACLQQNPPLPRPDLLAKTVLLNVNHAMRILGVTAVVRNIGQGIASGPFRIDFAVTMFRGNETISRVRVFEAPAGVTLFGEPVATPADAISIPFVVTFPQREYVTERWEVPLFYRDEHPSCTYEFDFLVDAEQVIAEANENNNRFVARWWTTTPAALQREEPFVIESTGSSLTQPTKPQ